MLEVTEAPAGQKPDVEYEYGGPIVTFYGRTAAGYLFLGGESKTVEARDHHSVINEARDKGLVVAEYDPW